MPDRLEVIYAARQRFAERKTASPSPETILLAELQLANPRMKLRDQPRHPFMILRE
jgi:hypothetical protein